MTTTGTPYHPINLLRDEIETLRRDTQQALNNHAGGVRRLMDERMAPSGQYDQKLADLQRAVAGLSGTRSGQAQNPHLVQINSIPGKRIPYTLLIDIPIGANTSSVKEQSVTVSMEGPFVAVRRMAIFQSALEFQVTPRGGATTRYSGRTFGRYRPIHSAWDIMDSAPHSMMTTANPMANGSMSAALELPNASASARSMEFDGRISVINAGNGYPRQNIPVPSSMWTTQINAPMDLASLDFFDRGEIISVQVTPNHVNNPSFGNVNASIMGTGVVTNTGGWPFLDGQFDAQEGIAEAGDALPAGAFNIAATPLLVNLAASSVVRQPDGILTIGWEGYRIINIGGTG